MKREDAIKILKKHRKDLQSRGVRHAALFGSLARGEAGPKSDIDILIDVDPSAVVGIFAYAGLKRHIGELFGGRVDVVDRETLEPRVRQSAESDAVYAF
jgi:predicted nucleotidyltransferase